MDQLKRESIIASGLESSFIGLMMKRAVSPLQQSFHRKAALIVSDPIMLLPGVVNVKSAFVLEKVKETTVLPLTYIDG